MTTLLEAVRRHADAQGIDGPIATPIPGLLVVRATSPSELMHDVQRPLVYLEWDNLDQVVAAEGYDGDGVTVDRSSSSTRV